MSDRIRKEDHGQLEEEFLFIRPRIKTPCSYVGCTGWSIVGLSLCESHRRMKYTAQRNRYERLKKLAVCTQCGRPTNGNVFCPLCNDKQEERRRERVRCLRRKGRPLLPPADPPAEACNSQDLPPS